MATIRPCRSSERMAQLQDGGKWWATFSAGLARCPQLCVWAVRKQLREPGSTSRGSATSLLPEHSRLCPVRRSRHLVLLLIPSSGPRPALLPELPLQPGLPSAADPRELILCWKKDLTGWVTFSSGGQQHLRHLVQEQLWAKYVVSAVGPWNSCVFTSQMAIAARCGGQYCCVSVITIPDPHC